MIKLQKQNEILYLRETVTRLERDFSAKELTINGTKSEIMRISFLKPRLQDLPEVGIPVVQKMRILGAIFNDRLTWDDQINHLISQIIPLQRSLQNYGLI